MAVPPNGTLGGTAASCFTSTFPRPPCVPVTAWCGRRRWPDHPRRAGGVPGPYRVSGPNPAVLDPTEVTPVDGYEVQRLRAAVRAKQIADVFPFGTCVSPTMDLDHTERYCQWTTADPGSDAAIGPMARPSHRAVTHGGWTKHQPEPGYFLPLTNRVCPGHEPRHARPGRTDFSAAVWEASRPNPDIIAASRRRASPPLTVQTPSPPVLLQVTVVLPQPCEASLCRGIRPIRSCTVDVHQGGAYAGRHGVGVAAHVDHRTGLDEIPD